MKNYYFIIIPLVILSIIFIPQDVFGEETIEQIQNKMEYAVGISKQNPDQGYILIFSNTSWQGSVPGNSPLSSKSVNGNLDKDFMFACKPDYPFSAVIQKQTSGGYLLVAAVHHGKIIARESTTSSYGVVTIGGMCESPPIFGGGGCLIATATYGSELAPQVQKLREIRDAKLLQTESGTGFMESFNSFYYSFSPAIADYERENPVFKEAVKLAITPMLSTLSLMDYADSESEVLEIGISLIILNIGMYFVAPGIIIYKVLGTKSRIKSRESN